MFCVCYKVGRVAPETGPAHRLNPTEGHSSVAVECLESTYSGHSGTLYIAASARLHRCRRHRHFRYFPALESSIVIARFDPTNGVVSETESQAR
jgi:hypothetical protein